MCSGSWQYVSGPSATGRDILEPAMFLAGDNQHEGWQLTFWAVAGIKPSGDGPDGDQGQPVLVASLAGGLVQMWLGIWQKICESFCKSWVRLS